MSERKRKQSTYTIPATAEDLQRVDAMVDAYLPVKVSRAAIMHTCLELGLDALEARQKKGGGK
jgi:hypothetical protein